MADLKMSRDSVSGLIERFRSRGDGTFAAVTEADLVPFARAASGQYFRTTNPTWGTGIAAGIVTGFVATTPLLTIDNSDAAGGVSIVPDYIKLINTAPGASSTSAHLGLLLDAIARWSSGGSALTAVNAKSGAASVAKASIHFGALTALAASAPKQVSRDAIKTQASPCWVAGDEVLVKFGVLDGFVGPTNGAATQIYPAPVGPVIIDPGHSAVLYQWNPANAVTPPSWEIEMGWWELVLA